jgi:CheY-like chemotaxis protein
MNTDTHGASARSRTVLLVDDEKMVLDVGKAILERLGHEVITATNGEKAIDLFLQHRKSIGCVVLDLTMPGMDGQETFEKLRRTDPDMPVIIASGLAADQVSAQFGDKPPSSIIQKPYQVADLSTTIQNILKEGS